MPDKLEQEEKTPVLITISNKDIDRIYWRFFLNSLLLSLLVSVAGFCILVFTAFNSMRYETRPSRSSSEQTYSKPASSEPTSTVTTTSEPTTQTVESTLSAEDAAKSEQLERSKQDTTNCVEKMQTGQIEAYNECVKNK